MGFSPKKSLEDYWDSYWLFETKFSDVLSRHRYQMLQAFFHVSDIQTHIPRGQDGYKPLAKIQPLLDLLVPQLSAVYYPHREISIDESMARFKGRCHFRQFMPDKPTKRGFKVFVVCDARNYYALNLMIYTGKEHFVVPQDKSFTEHLVTTLMARYMDKGHVLFMDNFYSSPSLFATLQGALTGAVGTVVESRRDFPAELKRANLILKKGDDPVFYRSNDMVAVSWHDTKRVNLLSTVHTNNTVHKRIRAKDAPGGYRSVDKPVIADTYNSFMGGVDHFDQLMKNYAYPHRNYKWYHALYHYLKDLSLVNGCILMVRDGHSTSAKDFRKSVVDALIRPHMIRRQNDRHQTNNAVDRLNAAAFGHFPAKFADPKHRPVCKVCASVKKRAQCRHYCPTCNVALCIDNCFRIYHTAKDIKEARQQLTQ
ncbi:piggyBac transposable element-derived protein 4-like [Aplysia californica]|uniref:PiggyBac transposable element-derived protein 4-like n=1 Tax=Aplysia californica TaxID=6500 RepID=A0ABM1A244_APLCA|nr:piggyBac transposable element-derived protein 4-like [Aplysia californica]